jgi:hypothetical protein
MEQGLDAYCYLGVESACEGYDRKEENMRYLLAASIVMAAGFAANAGYLTPDPNYPDFIVVGPQVTDVFKDGCSPDCLFPKGDKEPVEIFRNGYDLKTQERRSVPDTERVLRRILHY